MDTSKLKRFAPECRNQLIEQIGVKLDYVLTTRTPDLAEQEKLVKALQLAVDSEGREHVIDRVAYTWFNRLTALRYLDAHGWHPFRMRVLTPATEGDTQPELLRQVRQGVLPDELADYISTKRVNDLLDGKLPSPNPQAEVQRLIIIGVCQYYAFLLPGLFERIDDFSQLLLPDDLLTEHSIAQGFRADISDEDCADVEIIGWLYQFYISEKKDQVIGKVVKSEDIPAATQLFTPNWIVKYMVENSLGAQWLATYPDSSLKGQMEYYIEPAEQTDEVKAQLAAITPDQLNPEELTLIDPASGSGHILVEAYEIFKTIYLERGYTQRDAAKLILEKNIFGLDIDERAAQLTGFALMMKARADDRRLFERGVKLNVMALQDSTDFNVEGLARGVELGDYGLKPENLTELTRLFEHATTFGSLIQVPEGLAKKLPAIKQLSEASSQDLFVSEALKRLAPLVQQAELLAAQYDAVVANPPYMGGRFMNPSVKRFANDRFPDAKSDVFACFIERAFTLTRHGGQIGMVTMQSWMFLSSFQKMREELLREITIRTMAHLGSRAFGSISGEVVQTTAFVLNRQSQEEYRPVFFRLLAGDEDDKRTALLNRANCFDGVIQGDFKIIPGSPLAYWVTREAFQAFSTLPQLGEWADVKEGINTGDNDLFLRFWWEPRTDAVGLACADGVEAKGCGAKWFPCNKGGTYRKWYGNNDYVVNWQNDGERIRGFRDDSGTLLSRIMNTEYFFRTGMTWSGVGSSGISFRAFPAGFTFNSGGRCIFLGADNRVLLSFLNSSVCNFLLGIIAPTINRSAGDVARLPASSEGDGLTADRASKMTRHVKVDWDAYERSWDFQSLPILTASSDPTRTLESSYNAWITQNRDTVAEMKRLEEENNRLFIDAYGLADELTPDVPLSQITLTVNPAYRYGGKLTEEEQWTRFRQETIEELVSYAIGCMMGRYSLDAPGLIYAHSGNEGFDPSKYTTFPADNDAIIPITEDDWFEDDAASRVREFLRVTFGPETLEQNIAFLEEALGKDLRKYFTANSGGFYADHVKTYKKRPIYWLFESPKKHFRALVYLHRYTKDTVNTLLNGYLREFHHKLTAKIDDLQYVVNSADASARDKTAAQKALDKAQAALRDVEHYERDILLPLAQQRLEIDLDDGVKANYPKFGKALAKVAGLS